MRTSASCFGLGIGDVVHNLRGALDHAFWQLACVRWGGLPPLPRRRRIQFPMDDDPGFFAKRQVRDDLRPDDWTDLIEPHQPYHGQDGRPDSWSGPHVHPLALLRDLTDHDKHRITTPTFLIPSRFSISAKSTTGVSFAIHGLDGQQRHSSTTFLNASGEVALDAEVMRTLLEGAQDKIYNAGLVTPQVALSEGRPAIATIDRLTRRVDLILGEIEGRFP